MWIVLILYLCGSIVEWSGWVCRSSSLVCSCVYPIVLPPARCPQFWKLLSDGRANEWLNHAESVARGAPWGIARGEYANHWATSLLKLLQHWANECRFSSRQKIPPARSRRRYRCLSSSLSCHRHHLLRFPQLWTKEKFNSTNQNIKLQKTSRRMTSIAAIPISVQAQRERRKELSTTTTVHHHRA